MMNKDKDIKMYRKRLQLGLSQQALGDELGLSRNVINRIENKDYSICSEATIAKVKDFLELWEVRNGNKARI